MICLSALLFRDSEQLLSAEGKLGAGLHAQQNSSRRSNVSCMRVKDARRRIIQTEAAVSNTCRS